MKAEVCSYSEGKFGHIKRCAVQATKCCAFAIVGPAAGNLCGRAVCDDHAVYVAGESYYCEIHSHWAEIDRVEMPIAEEQEKRLTLDMFK